MSARTEHAHTRTTPSPPPSFTHLAEILLELLVGFFPLKVLKVLLAVRQHRVNVLVVLHRQVKRAAPVVQAHVELDGSVYQRWRGLQQHPLGLERVSTKERQLRLPTLL